MSINFGKYRAPRVHEIVKTRLLSGELVKKPLWFDVLYMYPPIHTPISPIHHDKSRFSATLMQTASSPSSKPDTSFFRDEKSLSKEKMEEYERYCRGLSSRRWNRIEKYEKKRWKKSVIEASRLFSFPEEITYPEDRLREKFYEDHPLERLRPRVLQEVFEDDTGAPVVEKTGAEYAEMFFGSTKTPSGKTEAKKENEWVIRDAEDVVRYTQHLISNERLDEDEAYEKACKIFYENRVKEEDEMKRLQRLAADMGAETLDASSESENQAETGSDDQLLEEWLKMEKQALDEAYVEKMEEIAAKKEREISRKQTTAL